MATPVKDLLLLVWVHGFKGNDVTFESFPARITHLLQQTHPLLKIESRVFPVYQTRGELNAATFAFVDWLTTLTVTLENDLGIGGGAGKARVVLIGHSMGGLLIADAALDIWRNTREEDPLWPNVVGLMAFDTPYLGLHPHVFKHSLSTAATYYEQAKSVASAVGVISPMAVGLGSKIFGSNSTASPSAEAGPSRSRPPTPSFKGKEPAPTVPPNPETPLAASKTWWSVPQPSTKTLYGIGAVALGAAAMGTAYYRREDFFNGWKWGYEHMTFVGNLWDAEALRARLDLLDELGKKRNVRFWNFYTHLPPSPPSQLTSRTFTILPPPSHPLYSHWHAATNSLAQDEITAHMYMFSGKTNDGFYDLGLEVVRGIGERIEEDGVGRVGEVDGEKGLGEGRGPLGIGGGNQGGVKREKDGWRQETDKEGHNVWVEV